MRLTLLAGGAGFFRSLVPGHWPGYSPSYSPGCLPGLLLGLFLGLFVAAAPVSAQAPAGGKHCQVERPPADAGALATPGGFLLVHPRNAGVTPDYTGCRTLWVMQAPDDTPLFLRVYFVQGKASRISVWDGRGGQQAEHCTMPDCKGIDDNELIALDLPTWPRSCAERPDPKLCRKPQ